MSHLDIGWNISASVRRCQLWRTDNCLISSKKTVTETADDAGWDFQQWQLGENFIDEEAAEISAILDEEGSSGLNDRGWDIVASEH